MNSSALPVLRGLDLSFASCSRQQAAALRAAGYRIAIQNLWTGRVAPEHRISNLENLLAEGFIVAGYTVITPNLGADCVNIARSNLPPNIWNELTTIAIDAEVDGISVFQIADALDLAEALGKKRLIYTAHWFWHGHLNNPNHPRNTKLWNAYYDADPDIDFQQLPYGNWSIEDLIGEQYLGSHQEHGVEIDSNIFRADFFSLPAPAPTAEAPMQIIGHPDQSRAYLVVGSKTYLIPNSEIWWDLATSLYGGNLGTPPSPKSLTAQTWDWLRTAGVLPDLDP